MVNRLQTNPTVGISSRAAPRVEMIRKNLGVITA